MAAQQTAATPPVDEPREFHVGVLGCTGFVGKLIAAYLCDNYGTDTQVKFVLAARSAQKLEDLKRELARKYGLNEKDINTAVADVGDYRSLVELAKRCRVLLTTVGPYMLYGEPVARACVEARTHYCDLTAEMPFVALLHARHGAAAKERGVKLVSFCGTALHRDPHFGYATFFIMARANENVVRWTNALLNYRYGRDFVYYEMLACHFNFLTCLLTMICLYTALLSVACPLTRSIGRLLRLLPAPGEGPAAATLNGGCFCMQTLGLLQQPQQQTQQQPQQQQQQQQQRPRKEAKRDRHLTEKRRQRKGDREKETDKKETDKKETEKRRQRKGGRKKETEEKETEEKETEEKETEEEETEEEETAYRDRKKETGKRRQETGERRQETGERGQKKGDRRRQEKGDRKKETEGDRETAARRNRPQQRLVENEQQQQQLLQQQLSPQVLGQQEQQEQQQQQQQQQLSPSVAGGVSFSSL
ncbi:saccharopine dehydrogenase, putative [Eimeria brunetti]|uniref:Saccharopine dehydrogenase, putative n=1 Tax=Eimeria brunetti TaxID=51314 RepID=U6LKX1_9EIME|nr:saccharopine dehydrogenase, putative [Eimeria brunetti]